MLKRRVVYVPPDLEVMQPIWDGADFSVMYMAHLGINSKEISKALGVAYVRVQQRLNRLWKKYAKTSEFYVVRLRKDGKKRLYMYYTPSGAEVWVRRICDVRCLWDVYKAERYDYQCDYMVGENEETGDVVELDDWAKRGYVFFGVNGPQ